MFLAEIIGAIVSLLLTAVLSFALDLALGLSLIVAGLLWLSWLTHWSMRT